MIPPGGLAPSAEGMPRPEVTASFNATVRFALKDFGSTVLRAFRSGLEAGEQARFQADQNGYLSMSLWDVAIIFGHAMQLGEPPIFGTAIEFSQSDEVFLGLALAPDSLLRVKVTATGEEVWDRHHQRAREAMRFSGQGSDHYRLSRDEEGYTNLLLREVLYVFGSPIGKDREPLESEFRIIASS